MNTPVKLGIFALALATAFGVTYGIGHAVGPVGGGHDLAGTAPHGGHDAAPESAGHLPAGLQVSDRGYTMNPVQAAPGEFAFQILGPDGRPVTGYDVAHDRRMHLIVARRDLSGFRHVHPTLGADGTWRVTSPLGEAGAYRAFADFTPTGAPALTLGVDVLQPGSLTVRPLPGPATTATVDGYDVTLAGQVTAGQTSTLTLTVSRDGHPVTDLQPYLGAYGHLVALRAGDLAYLHVHPDGAPGDGRTSAGPAITFLAEVPSVGTYRLYLDFQYGGVVRTAEFTVTTRS